ncbi:alpha/beta hydrolase family protein [Egicoccus halophilus]|uniref:Alpha/beta hydrolase n=1 Tax=Egicoccus halophilus TaxID=1670830 RepID=A0A8J3AD58_9ACTN|nr:alpha/beta family hydrolase [Egicoccus halophilus]GGI09501.1 alpha/beta hydrolase [Egicoccus halophilus]
MSTERRSLPVTAANVDHVTASLHVPDEVSRPPVLLTHGAGGDLDGEGLVALAEVLAGLGCVVVRANLPYREAGRRAAPRAESSVAPFLSLWAAADALLRDEGLPTAGPGWVLGGKSYGGRVASLATAMAAAEDRPAAAGLLFYGYPLHPPGKPDKLRVDHWPSVPVPCLFLQGDRDPFFTRDLFEEHVRKLPRRATLQVVEGGDHSLQVTGAASPDGTPRGAVQVLQELEGPLADWLGSLDR